MAKGFDATTRELLERDPRAWLGLIGVQTSAPVEVINSDLSTVSAEADKVIRINSDPPWLVQIELQASYNPDLPRRQARYNLLLNLRHGMPVLSAAILLRPAADGPNLSGVLQQQTLDGWEYLSFRYRVFRTWEQSAEELLAGDVTLLPLVPLASASEPELPVLLRQTDARLSDLPQDDSRQLWSAAYILLGLRYSEAFVKQLFQGIRDMTESTTYQGILREGEIRGEIKGKAEGKAEGRVEEARRMLLRFGTPHLGAPDQRIRQAVEAMADVAKVEELSDRILQVETWDELLAEK